MDAAQNDETHQNSQNVQQTMLRITRTRTALVNRIAEYHKGMKVLKSIVQTINIVCEKANELKHDIESEGEKLSKDIDDYNDVCVSLMRLISFHVRYVCYGL